jgi:hypothetical protein
MLALPREKLMRMMRHLALAAFGLSVLPLTGCVDIEQALTLERNLSGKAVFTVKFEVDSFVGFFLRMQREAEGKKGDPTPAEVAAARKVFLEGAREEARSGFDAEMKKVAESLPEGVTFADARFLDDATSIGAVFHFVFDDISKLKQVKLPQPGGPPGPGGGQGRTDPFEELQVVDDGKTILIRAMAENPLDDQKPDPKDAAAMKEVEGLFKGLRVAFRMTSPLEVLEHNAHRKDGTTLIWEYDFGTLVSLISKQLSPDVRVRYRK